MDKIKEIPAQAKLALQKARARSGVFDISMRTFKKFSEDDGGSYAAALTYYTFFSIFPMLFFAASVLGYVTLGNEELRNDILQAGLDSVPLLADVLSPGGLTFIEERRQGFAITGAVMALYSGTGAIVALQHALNRFQGLVDEPNWVQKRLRSLKFVAIFGLAVVTSVALGAVAGFATSLFATDTRLNGQVIEVVAWTASHVVGFLVGVLIFAGAYKFLPALRRSWRDVLPGAIIAAFLFEVLKEVGATYLEQGSQGREATFGVFALSAGLLVACYLISQITLMAAEVNNVILERRLARQTHLIDTKEA